MAWTKAYTRINWVNDPSTDTPLNATNLNLMDAAINTIDNRVLQLENQAYVHIKYSAYAEPTNIQMTDTPSAYMGICVTSSDTAPTIADDYAWNRVRGEVVEIQATDTYIQWKYESDASWTNLVAIADISGADGARGSRWNSGTAITGTSTTPTAYTTGISDSLAGDYYINTSTSYVYRCILGGDASTALWAYSHNQHGIDGTGTGDMTKAVYDADNDGTVDDSEKLGGQLPAYYAKSGANNDITSITGLTTALPVSEGGTGATSASVGLANLGGSPRTIEIVEITTSTNISSDHNGKWLWCTNSSNITLTFPTGLSAGINGVIKRWGAGTVTLATSSTTLNGSATSLTLGDQYKAAVSFVAVQANVFSIEGNYS